jgi:beta-glucanase (GH16 family)
MRRPRLAFCVPVALGMILSVGATAGISQAAQPRNHSATAHQPRRHRLAAGLEIPPGPKPPSGKAEFVATFSGTRLDTKVWDTCYPYMSQTGCTNFGNKEEAEWYVPGQVRVYGGDLHLIAKREKTEGTNVKGKPKVYYCRSGMVTSHPGLRFKYGYMQVVAKIPHGLGLWPALWMLPANETGLPEIDILESWGVNVKAGSFFHPYPKGSHSDRGLIPVRWTKGWQTYALNWTKDKMQFYVGKRLVLTVHTQVPHSAMYFIADLAEYLPAAKGYCTGQLEIHSIRVWKN